MNLGDIIKRKVSERKQEILDSNSLYKKCVRCGQEVTIDELKANSKFPAYKHKEICDQCTDFIDSKVYRPYL
jgi:hypothetical protein